MSKFVIATVGMCGTGKSVVTNYIERNYKFKSIYFGGFVLQEVKNRNLNFSQSSEKLVREDLRKLHGKDVFAKMAYDSIVKTTIEGYNVIIDGLYSMSEYLFLKEHLQIEFLLLAIHADKKLRYIRMAQRTHRSLNSHEVDDRDLSEIINLEKGGPIAIANYHLINNGNIDVLNNTTDKIMSDIMLSND